MAVEFSPQDMLALVKIESQEALKEFKKDEVGSCKEHLERIQELILAFNDEV